MTLAGGSTVAPDRTILDGAAVVTMDGARTGRLIARIILPTVRPALATAFVFGFITAWNEFLFGLILTTQHAVPMTVGAVAMVLFGARQVQLQRRDRAFLDLRPFWIGQVMSGWYPLVYLCFLIGAVGWLRLSTSEPRVVGATAMSADDLGDYPPEFLDDEVPARV